MIVIRQNHYRYVYVHLSSYLSVSYVHIPQKVICLKTENMRISIFYPSLMSWVKQLPSDVPRSSSLNLKTLCHYSSKKGKQSERNLTKRFIDWRHIVFMGGQGGDGCISMRREAHVQFGGPDGGNGGNGGNIVLRSTERVKSLGRVLATYIGDNGANGSNCNSHGKSASHSIIEVPLGTIVKENNMTLVDLKNEGDEFVAAYGGTGGKGNKHFLSNENRAPQIATRGMPGEQRTFELELRVIAQVGLIGFPNAGKSTLLQALSRARPVIAAYPFTTLNPHVGMVEFDDMEQVAVADIPGLIHGAHLNKGLGHSFLKHIERCLGLLYVIDLSEQNPVKQLHHLKYELNQYHPGLAEKPHAVVGNKIDLPEANKNLKTLQRNIDLPVIAISAHYKLNIATLKKYLRELYIEDVNILKEQPKKR